jgi:hypothetical protein
MSTLRTDGCYERRDPDNVHREYVAVSHDAYGTYWFTHVYQVWEQGIGVVAAGSPREWRPTESIRCRDEAEALRRLEAYATDRAFRHSSEFANARSGW